MVTRALKWIGVLGFLYLAVGLSNVAWTQGMNQDPLAKPPSYRLLKKPPALTTGTVKMEVFVDFYCAHCHRFEASVLPDIKKEFGEKLEVTEVGFPVIRNKPMLSFEIYEAARAEGKGPAMAQVLFRVLQEENGDIQDPQVRIQVAKEAGLDPDELKKRLLSGQPKRAIDENIARAARDGVNSAPTIILDGYVVTEDTSPENLRALIGKLLSGKEF